MGATQSLAEVDLLPPRFPTTRGFTDGMSDIYTTFGASTRADILVTPFASQGAGLDAQLSAVGDTDVQFSIFSGAASSGTTPTTHAAPSTGGFRVAARAGTGGDGPTRARGALHMSSSGSACALASVADAGGRGGAWVVLPFNASNSDARAPADGSDFGFGADGGARVRQRDVLCASATSAAGAAHPEVGARLNGSVRDIAWSVGAHTAASTAVRPTLANPPPLKVWAVAHATRGLSLGAALALPSGNVDAAVSLSAAEPASEVTAELNGAARTVTAGLTRAFAVRRRVYNPFEDSHVKGIWMHGRLALETRRRLDPPGEASLAAGVTLQLNRIAQVAARVTSDRHGPLLALAGSLISWTQPALRLTVTSHITPSAQAAFGARLDITMDPPLSPAARAHSDYGGGAATRAPAPHAPSLRLPVTEAERIASARESIRAVARIDANAVAGSASASAKK